VILAEETPEAHTPEAMVLCESFNWYICAALSPLYFPKLSRSGKHLVNSCLADSRVRLEKTVEHMPSSSLWGMAVTRPGAQY
jgi:hypothetical protein